MPDLAVTALAPWFGSNRMLAQHVGEELAGCRWVGVPFAGGMCELAHIDAPSIVVSDLHRHVINLALVVRDRRGNQFLSRLLADSPFHPDLLAKAQAFCRKNEPRATTGAGEHAYDVDAAYWYFLCCWLGRSHKCGIDDEFNGGLSIRWNANGGDSNTRYRSAVRSLAGWRRIMRRCNFSVLDCFEFLDQCDDQERHGIYCDPPFPGPGDRYKHRFTTDQQRKLASKLATFRQARVVCRFYDHPLVRELYPEPAWTWRRLKGRKQSNEAAPEVLILNGPSRACTQNGRLFG